VAHIDIELKLILHKKKAQSARPIYSGSSTKIFQPDFNVSSASRCRFSLREYMTHWERSSRYRRDWARLYMAAGIGKQAHLALIHEQGADQPWR
jgi:hypothetical protein